MKKLTVYDPAMCCSSGVCGPSVDPRLVKLAADLAFLKSKGVEVQRYNLGHQPQAFTASPVVMAEMGPLAEHLPVFLVDDELKAKGRYPDRRELSGWFGLEIGITSDKPRMDLKVLGQKEI